MILNTEDLIYLINDYEQKLKDFGVEPAISPDNVKNVTESFDNLPQKYKDQINLVKNGDYSNFNSMPAFLRNYLGAIEVQKCVKAISELSLHNPEFTQYLEANATNPVFRAGVSAGREDDKIQKASDEYMSRYLLEKTLQPPTDEEKDRVTTALGEEGARKVFEENKVKQRIIAKTLFMAQIGAYIVRLSENNSAVYEDEISNTVAHGGRTNFVLPYGGDQTAVMNAFISNEESYGADVYGRAAATHTVTRKKIHQEGLAVADTKEGKPTFIGYFRKHYGMDISAGGLGTLDANNRTVLSNGSNGHLYMRMEKGDSNHCGSLLIGFESCAPSKTTTFGHKHTMFATSSRQTCFLANKGGVGKNTDGRVVDLSGLKPEDFIMLMNAFNSKYAELQNESSDAINKTTLESINKMLCGKRLLNEELVTLLKAIEIPDAKINGLLNASRDASWAFESRFDPKTMSKEECEDLMRREISTEEACTTAINRYKGANSLTNAVGAIKELQKIHDTRGFFWKIFHPFKNAMEKNTIKELIERLANDSESKGYVPNAILNEFKADTDTYLLKYEIYGYKKGVSLLERYDKEFVKNPNQESYNEKFAELGEKAKELVMKLRDIRYNEHKIEFDENAHEVEPTRDAIKVQRKMNRDKVDVYKRAEKDYDMLTQEANDLKLLDEATERSISEENAIDKQSISNVERENIIVEEADFEDDSEKSVEIDEKGKELIKDLSSKN